MEWFQTLLSWMSRRRPGVMLRHWDRSLSFKPCCPGCRAAARVGRSGSNKPRWVSNLVVLDVAPPLAGSSPSPGRGPGFQTLLSWMSRRRLDLGRAGAQGGSVSNLVVLDVAPPPESAVD